MEDKDIKQLFSDFTPPLTSSNDFVKKIEEKIDAVEYVKTSLEANKRVNKAAVVIAAVIGFVTGIVCMLLFPTINDVLNRALLKMLDSASLSVSTVISYLLICAAVVLASYGTYFGLSAARAKS